MSMTLMEAFVRVGIDASRVQPESQAAGAKAGATFGTSFDKASSTAIARDSKGRFTSAAPAATVAGADAGKRYGSAFGSSVKSFAGPLLATFGTIAAASLFRGSIDEAREAQKVGAQTAAVLKSTGLAAGVSALDVERLAAALSEKVGVDDEAIQSGENLLLTFRNIRNEAGAGNDVFNLATAASLDLAAAMKTDLSSAAKQVGKALNDPTAGLTALTRSGVSFTEQQKAQIAALQESGDLLGAQKVILAELAAEFAGSAAAQRTWGDQAATTFGNIEEELGTQLLPLLDSLSKWFVEDGADALRDVGGFIRDDVIPPLQLTAEVVGTAVEAFDKLPGPVKETVAVLGLAALAVKGLDAAAASRFGTAVAAQFTAIKTAATATDLSLSSVGATATAAGKKFLTSRTGVGALGIGLSALGSQVDDSNTGLNALVNTAAAAALGFSVTGGPWGAAIGGTVGLLTSLGGEADRAAASVADLQKTLDPLTASFTDLTRQAAAQDLAQFSDQLKAAGIDASVAVDAYLGNADALAQIRAQMGQTTTTLKSYNDYQTSSTSAAEYQSTAFDDLFKIIEQGTANLSDAQKAQLFVADATREVAAAAVTTSSSLYINRDAVVSLTEAYQSLNAELSKRGSIRDYQAALDAADAALAKNGKTLNIHTAEGRENAAALDDVAAKALAHAQALDEDGASAERQRVFLERARDALIAEAKQFGLSKDAARDYANEVLDIPANRETQIDLLIEKAKQDAREFRDLLAQIKSKQITVEATFLRHGQIDPGVRGALGGTVRGGIPGRDSVHALLMPGEEVIPSGPATRHRALLKAISSGGILGLAGGGTVGSLPNVPIPGGASDETKALIRALNGLRFGLRTDAGAIHDQFAGLIGEVRRNLGKDSPLVGRLADIAAKSVEEARDRQEIVKQLGVAASKLEGLEQAQRQLVSSTAASFTANPFTAAGATSVQGQRAFLRDQLSQAKAFELAETVLIKKGLPRTLISQLVGAGPDALAKAQALAKLSPDELASYANLARRQANVARSIAQRAGEAVFGDRIDAGRDVVEGLRAHRDEITKELKHYAQEAVRAVTRALDGDAGHDRHRRPRAVGGRGDGQGIAVGDGVDGGRPWLNIEHMHVRDEKAAARELAQRRREVRALAESGG